MKRSTSLAATRSNTSNPETRAAPVNPTYAAALELHDAGFDDEELAQRIGVDPAAVPALLELARAKLASRP